MVPVADRPTGPIVWNLSEGVKQYEAWGAEIPFWRPESCPACGRVGTLVGHGKRKHKKSPRVFVRRVRCGRRGRPETCGKTFTVLPCFLYPFFHYGLDVIQPVLLGRFAEYPPRCWRELRRGHPASDSTLFRWAANFRLAAPPWNKELLASFVKVREEFALPRAVTESSATATLSLAGLFLDWKEREITGQGLEASMLLQRLWGWGHERLKKPLFLSTIFAKGAGGDRQPKRAPPNF